ncbi:MAG: hypothetical protein VX874_09670 [Pseudomonadota bacterium]|nr:hypothetical protein [Pseudomonadota bacterium]
MTEMTVRDYLNIPYTLLAEPVEVGDGIWLRRLSYPELGGFHAEGVDVETVYLDVERMRFAEIMKRLQTGDLPPVPRPPLSTATPEWWARFLGIGDEVTAFLDKTPEDYRRSRSN